jgi:ABC-type uncharacterized transport system involved in gliding motility auxiliary subunit
MRTWLFPLWVIMDVLVFLAVAALWIAAPEYTTLNTVLTVFAFCLGLLLAFVRWKEIVILAKSAYFKKALYHTFNVLLVMGILGLVNYLGNKNQKDFDLTSQKKNTLTEQTKKVVEMVKAPMKLTVYAKREEWGGILNVLKLFRNENKNIQLEAIDIDLRPDLVKEKEIQASGTVTIEYKEKVSSFVISDELSVTNAFLKALRDTPIVLYVISGHQELSCLDQTPEGLSNLCDQMKSQNYEVQTLDLTKVKEIPKDATAILVLGPINGYLEHEAKILEAFLNRGGSAFIALAPAFKSEVYDNLIKLGAPYGLTLGRDVVVDRLSTVQGAEATIPVVSKYEEHHKITEGFTLRTIFPLSSSVRTIEGNDTATLLAMTSSFPGSWAETDLKAVTNGKAVYKEGEDLKGPVGLLGVGEKTVLDTDRDSRFVLLGSSSFLINAYQGQSGNTTLFLNAINWMADDEGIISLNRPGVEETPVILSGQHLQMIFVISILVVPIVFFGAAIFIYRRRRQL